MTPNSPTLNWRAVPKFDRQKRPILDAAGAQVVEQYAIVSSCGRFTIARVICGGIESFELWKVPPDGEAIGGKMLGTKPTADRAKSLAELAAGEPSPQAGLF